MNEPPHHINTHIYTLRVSNWANFKCQHEWKKYAAEKYMPRNYIYIQ